jgi:tetratricopeptide (TPR) repeat protein
MQKKTEEHVVKFINPILSGTTKFIAVVKCSPLFLIIAIFTYFYLMYTGYYIYTSPTPSATLSESLGVISILIGLAGLLYTLFSAITSGKQLGQSLKDLSKIQIDYWNIRGIDQIREKKFYDASQSYQMAININPNDVRIWINIAGSLFHQEMYDDALKAINRAIEINPERNDVWNSKAIILREKAIASMEYDIELNTEITRISFFKINIPISQNIIYAENTMLHDAEICSKWNDKTKSLLAQAEFALKRALELKLAKVNECSEINQNWLDKYSLAGTWSNLGTIYSYQGDNKKAIDTYNEAIKLNPGYVEAWIDKGHALLSNKKLIEAIDAFDKAIKIDPKNSRAWSGKGYTYKGMGQKYLNDAIHAFNKSLEYDPLYLNALSGKGSVLFEIAKHDEAIRVSDVALEIDPFNIKMWINKCISLLYLNKYEEAFIASNRAIKLHYQYAFTWYNEYEKLYIIGKYDEAIRAHDNYLELVERISAIYTLIGDAALNSSLKYPTRLWDALISYNEAKNLNPLNIYSEVCRCMVLYILGFAKESKSAYWSAYRLKILSETPYQYVEIPPL